MTCNRGGIYHCRSYDGFKDHDDGSLLAGGIKHHAKLNSGRQINGLPDGTKFLVDLRADLLRFAREAPELRPLEHDLRRLMGEYFDVGFLDLHRITWNSPASLLETFAASEAVHEVTGWTDLKNRLDPDRRFFAFFHPCMPDEPLIFVQVEPSDEAIERFS